MATARGGRPTTRCSIHVLQNERGSSGMRAASHICILKANLTSLVSCNADGGLFRAHSVHLCLVDLCLVERDGLGDGQLWMLR